MRRQLFAIFLVSVAALGYEILLMRALSIVQWHHFAYMIISLALLGYGASGTFIAVFHRRLEQHFGPAFVVGALLFSAAIIGCFALGQQVPFNALEIVWDHRQLLWLAATYLVYFLPFFFAASCIGLAFTFRRAWISRIYFADLLGAGLGAVAITGMLFVLMPQDAVRVLATLAALAGVLGATPMAARRGWLLLAAACTAIGGIAVPERWLALHPSDYKGLSQALRVVDARAIHVSSSPLGLLAVVESPTVPFHYAPGLSLATGYIPPAQLGVFTDGDSMSAITRYDGDLGKLGFLGDLTAALPYHLLQQPEVLVLGAGGGADVLLALYHRARGVDAVELDPNMVDLVRETYSDFAGHLYEDRRVHIHIREARGFVVRSGRRWDLIQIGVLESFGAAGAGVQSLNENYLYTVEGLQQYIGHLRPDGMLSITRWLHLPPRDSLKLFATAVEALRATGVAEPGARLAMIRSWNTSTLIVKAGALLPGEIAALRDFARLHSFDVVWYPGMSDSEANRFNRIERPYLHEAAVALLGEQAGEFLERYKFDVAPATDDRPYFFHFFKWSSLQEVLALRKRGGAGLIEWGYLVLVATLVQAVLAGLLLILLPLTWIKRRWPAGTGARMGAYFFLLGLAFLFVEMAFIQKFILFLSHPLYSVAVVLSSFLVFAGLGSATSGRVALRSPVGVIVAVIAAIILSYLVFLPTVFEQFMGAPDLQRAVLAVLLIAPLAFCMGMPFPLGLNRLAQGAPEFIPWAWGINGFASVVSATLATLLAIEFGFVAVLLTALSFYIAAALVIRGWRPEMEGLTKTAVEASKP